MSRKIPPSKEIQENLKVASYNHDIATVYDRARKFIQDKRYLKRFDLIMGNLEYEEDAESFFEEVIEDYLAEEAEKKLGPRWGFGVHEMSGDFGFWEKNENGSYDLEYPGMVKRFDDEDEYDEEDDEEEDEIEDDDDEEDKSEDDEDEEEDEIEDDDDKEDDEEKSKINKEGVAEVLGENGEVIKTMKFKYS